MLNLDYMNGEPDAWRLASPVREGILKNQIKALSIYFTVEKEQKLFRNSAN